MNVSERWVAAGTLLAAAALLGIGSPTPWAATGILVAWGVFFLAERAARPARA